MGESEASRYAKQWDRIRRLVLKNLLTAGFGTLRMMTVRYTSSFRRRGRLPKRDRTHTAIFGMTGARKSTLARNMRAEDTQAGMGVTVLDPHGKLVEDALENLIPRERIGNAIHGERIRPGLVEDAHRGKNSYFRSVMRRWRSCRGVTMATGLYSLGKCRTLPVMRYAASAANAHSRKQSSSGSEQRESFSVGET